MLGMFDRHLLRASVVVLRLLRTDSDGTWKRDRKFATMF